jgi:hypothetical protein
VEVFKPVFIIGSYRGGTSLVFRLLSESSELWSLYRESNHMWQKYSRHPEEKSDTVILEAKSNTEFVNLVTGNKILDLQDAYKEMNNHYHYSSYNSYILGYLGRVKILRDKLTWLLDLINIFNCFTKKLFLKTYRIVDKTPTNMYRVEFLKALYPDAKFIYLVRDKQKNINSLINAWCHPRKFKYLYREYLGDVNIHNYNQKVWKFFIPVDYSNWMNGKTIEEVCTHQYEDAHQAAERGFRKISPDSYLRVSFEHLLLKPDPVMKEICDFVGVQYSARMKKIVREMPPVNTDAV